MVREGSALSLEPTSPRLAALQKACVADTYRICPAGMILADMVGGV